jgi:site-specific DNA-methyltransferase (adenine-specific)
MSRLRAWSIDVVVTSPPYNLGIKYGKYSDISDRASYLNWCEEWGKQIRRVLKPDGSFFLNVGSAPSNPMLPHELVLRLRTLFNLQNTIHWIKAITIEMKTASRFRASLQTISPRFPNDCHEYVFTLRRTEQRR